MEAEFDSENGLFGFDNLVFGTDKKCIPRWAITNFKQVMPFLSNLGLSIQNGGGVHYQLLKITLSQISEMFLQIAFVFVFAPLI